MTHSSGILVSKQLEQAFAKARTEGGIRWIKVEITIDSTPEEMVYVKQKELGEYESDVKELQDELQPKLPCYILFRKDSKNVQEELGYDWLFISFVPDGSPVKSRMLYASSRDNLKKGLGSPYFTYEIHASEKDEVTLNTMSNVDKKEARVLSESELQVKHETKLENKERGESVTSGDNVSVKFPCSDEAKQKLEELANGNINYVRLSLNIEKETIEYGGESGTFSLSELPSKVPEKMPSYHFYRWKHEYEGTECDNIVFIYCCPNGSPVKPRMLYSTVKTTTVNHAVAVKAEPSHKIEITGGEDWTEALMLDYVHPPKAEKDQGFNKPKKPGKSGRGLIKRNK